MSAPLSEKSIRVMLADDHFIVLMGLASLLELEDGIEVVGQARNGEEAVSLYRDLRPDVLLLDLQMPRLDGIGALEAITAGFPDARVIILTSFEREEEIHRVFEAGAKGYMLKESKSPDLAEAVRTVHGGGQWMPPEISRLMKESAGIPRLTGREVEVLDLVAKGLANKEIGKVLGITEDGAKFHMRSIFAKLGVCARTEAIAEGMRRGFIRQM